MSDNNRESLSRFRSILIVPVLLLVVLVACGGDAEKERENPTNSSQPPTPTATRQPTSTPGPTIDPSMTFEPSSLTESANPALELIAAPVDMCVNEDETQSTLLGFDAIYYRVATSNYVAGILETMDGEYIYEFGAIGEGRDGAEGFGFYPTTFAFLPNTPVTLTVRVYRGDSADSELSSISSLTYNCTTGEVIEKTFARQ
jgi:hypothetical protein